MTTARSVDDLVDDTETVPAKTRLCLRCQTKFESRWPGERICSRCKGSAAWRQGMPASSGSSSRR